VTHQPSSNAGDNDQQGDRQVRAIARAHRTRRACFAQTTIAILLLMPAVDFAQDVTEPALKAAYIYNFAKFTEWPAGVLRPSAPFVMCVLGDPVVGDALERAVKGRTLDGHSLTVALMLPTGPSQTCHVLYVSGVTAGQAKQLVAGVRDGPVLTIGDVEGFTEMGGIAQFFFEQGRLHFSVRLESAKRARLEVSSRLLALAQVK
jgi:hypothetical protein